MDQSTPRRAAVSVEREIVAVAMVLAPYGLRLPIVSL
jgi:hypothetical protein